MKGILYVCSTPIGNLGDVSARLGKVLADADLVAVEDTRISSRLFDRLGVTPKTTIYNDVNGAEVAPKLLRELLDGRTLALVTDAGTPTISDPGYRLVTLAIDAGVEVRVVPGPSAVTAALAVSGLPSDRFVFEGFLPRKARERRQRLEELSTEERTVVFFESPHRVKATLGHLRVVMGDRRVALCREMTKMHEEVLRGTPSEVSDGLADRVRGEIVIVVEGAQPQTALDEVVSKAKALLTEGLTRSAAAAKAARGTPFPKGTIYEELGE
jgi:16S rRNA (cytidine1402-2'-O)-methyltransferase